MPHSYDLDSLNGSPSKADLAITRKRSMDYSFMFERDKPEHAGETPLQTAVRDKSSQRKREAKQLSHSTFDLSMDNGLRERRSLLNGITRKHRCQGKTACKCGKLAAQPVHGLGMKTFMRDVVAQGKRKYHRVNRVLNSHNRAGSLLAIGIANDSVAAVAPLVRNHIRVIKAKDRGLV